MADKNMLKGIWRCTHCGNIEASEREVRCWSCGKGQMVFIERDKITAALNVLRNNVVAIGLPDPHSHSVGWDTKKIDGVWYVGMRGNLDTKHDGVVSVNQMTSDGAEAERTAKWIASTYNAALGLTN